MAIASTTSPRRRRRTCCQSPRRCSTCEASAVTRTPTASTCSMTRLAGRAAQGRAERSQGAGPASARRGGGRAARQEPEPGEGQGRRHQAGAEQGLLGVGAGPSPRRAAPRASRDHEVPAADCRRRASRRRSSTSTDADFSAETYIPRLEGLDLVEYKRRVESVLREHFAENAILQRIRAGQARARRGARGTRAGWSCRSTTRRT